VFGYVAMRFSLKWSIALHVINNGLATLIGTSVIGNIAFEVVAAACLVLVVVVAVLNRHPARALVAEGRSPLSHPFRWGWSHPVFILVILVMLALCTLMMVIL